MISNLEEGFVIYLYYPLLLIGNYTQREVSETVKLCYLSLIKGHAPKRRIRIKVLKEFVLWFTYIEMISNLEEGFVIYLYYLLLLIGNYTQREVSDTVKLCYLSLIKGHAPERRIRIKVFKKFVLWFTYIYIYICCLKIAKLHETLSSNMYNF
jgi:predicted transcriptional regulator